MTYPDVMERDDASPLPAAAQSRFQDAMRAFQSECFWSWDVSHPITSQTMAREVIRQLRLHGGKRGWRTAAELVRCL